MKISRDGPIPQLELGPHLGGLKTLYQRSGIVARLITMVSAMTAAWSTNPALQNIFYNSFALFLLAAVVILLGWMVFDYMFVIPSEQSFRQGQSQRSERSPLKNDTEEILDRLDGHPAVADGGDGDE